MSSPGEAHRRANDRIEHLIVVMLENRSYDHMLGFMDLGPDSPPLDPAQHPNPLDLGNPNGPALLPSEDAGYCMPVDPPHSFKRITTQINDGAMNGFAASLRKELVEPPIAR